MASISTGGAQETAYQPGPHDRRAFTTLTFLFFMWGFITCLNDILIPFLKAQFSLDYAQAMLVQFAFFGAYFVGSLIYFIISLASGDPISKIGYKNGILIGLALAALACFTFWLAAEYQKFGFFLGALFGLGLGLTLLQIACNPYVSLLGPPETSSARLNLAQALNSFGTTIAPLIGGYFILEYFAKIHQGVDAVKIPYLVLGGFFASIAFLIKSTPIPAFEVHEEKLDPKGIFKFRHLLLGALAIFMYVGGEVTIGSFIVNYLGDAQIASLSQQMAKTYLAFYWGGAMIGRFLGAISLSQLPTAKKALYMLLTSGLTFGVVLLAAFLENGLTFEQVLPFTGFLVLNYVAFLACQSKAGFTTSVFAAMVLGLLYFVAFGNGHLAMWCILSIGLFNSVMWSNIFTLAIKDLGKYSSQGSSLLVMAILGGALVPYIQGWFADSNGIQASFVVPMFCYAYIFYYGIWGSKVKPHHG
jgi:FHS family L-fucose permease-like MFS transporter